MLIFVYDNGVSFEKPVGLVARQEKLVGRFVDVYRYPFCDLSGILEFGVIGVCHFSKSK